MAGPDLLPLKKVSRRRRRHPLWTLLIVLVVAAGIGYLWYWVFNPLFTDPDDWAKKERTFRYVLKEVVAGADSGAPRPPELPKWPPPLADHQVRLLACADAQVARGVRRSANYRKLGYPWGDVPEHLGTDADLVIRCLRELRIDLQQMVHHDRKRAPRRYPLRIWSQKRPDTNIDHRRLPNLHVFIKHYAQKLPTLVDSHEKVAGFHPGDLVFWAPHGGGDHPGRVGIVTDRRGPDGVPRVVTFAHNDDRISDRKRINAWPIMGHYRVDPVQLLEGFLEANPGVSLESEPPQPR